MRLYLHHGRKTPDEELHDWGPNGPTLVQVSGIHQTYGGDINVFFENKDACQDAQLLTAWEHYQDVALTMRWREDLVVVTGPDGTMYYGDWGLIEDND